MKMTRRPMIMTVLYGLMCGVTFIPVSIVLNYVIYWPAAFRLAIWSYVAFYGFLLTRWQRRSAVSVVFPLLTLFIFVFWGNTNSAFLLLSLGVLGWIRSGICFRSPLARTLSVELLVSTGGGALVAYFGPHSTLTWAMGIWLFFLVQSLYFVLIGDVRGEDGNVRLDPFEEDKNQAERILSDGV